MMAAEAVHVVISGRVQGVAFRSFIEREAAALSLDGWVRNLRDGSVEAVFSGEPKAVSAILASCRLGPPGARVAGVETTAAAVVGPGFEILPTA